jgi:hypothetical protein
MHCTLALDAFLTVVGWSRYSATVGAYDESRIYQEGPNECDVVLLKDKKTLWAVMRVDGGDGTPSHRTLPFLAATSADGGRSWAKAAALPEGMLSAQPKATVLENGALLLTAGRPGVDLWVSPDGFGQSWQRFSIPTIHNDLVAAESHPADWKYCEDFLAVAANHTFAGDPTAKVDTLRDGGPLLGWAQTSGYNAVASLGGTAKDATALLCYDRQGCVRWVALLAVLLSVVVGLGVKIGFARICARYRWGGGYYGVGLAPVFGPKGAWPNGRAQPQGCYLDVSATFCVRVAVGIL